MVDEGYLKRAEGTPASFTIRSDFETNPEPEHFLAVLDESGAGEFLARAATGVKKVPNALKTFFANAGMPPFGPDLSPPVRWKWAICPTVVRRVNMDSGTS